MEQNIRAGKRTEMKWWENSLQNINILYPKDIKLFFAGENKIILTTVTILPYLLPYRHFYFIAYKRKPL